MKNIIACASVVWLLGFSSLGIAVAQTTGKKMITLPAEVVVDKIRGGMFGMMLGNMNGLPYEFKFYDKHGDVETYVPSLPKGAETDDDTDFEWVYIYNMQKMRTAYVPYEELNTYWKNSINRGIWNANRYARYLMDLDIKSPLTGTLALNPWAEFNVAGQFVCEAFGLVAPAMPQTAAKIGLHYTKISIGFEPAQTTQLFTAMISTAFVENDVNKIVDAGVASLDPKSIMVSIIADVRKWHALNPSNPAETHRLIHEKYVRADEIVRNRNGAELNTAVIIAAFLYGDGNFAETIRHGMNFGYDADCNTATLGTLVGAMYGHRRMMNEGWQIVDRYRNTKRDNMPMDETIISFSDRIIDVFEMINQQNGGSKSVVNNVVVYNIVSEKPASVEKLLTIKEEIDLLKSELGNSIVTDLLSGDKQATARAAYLAVALDMAGDLKKKYPKQWKEACFNLSGYWRVISNIFNTNNFELMKQFREKFAAAGFGTLNFEQNAKVLYSEKEIWKDPKSIYTVANQKNQKSEKSKPELIFQSGFEGTTRVVQVPNTNDYGARLEKITGKDNSLKEKSDWDKDWGEIMNGGFFQIQYTGGDSTQRYAKVVPEPGNPSNKVLKFWLDDSWSASENERKARIQANIYGLQEGLKEFYQSVRVYLTDDFEAVCAYPQPLWWLTLSEFWNNEWWVAGEKYGFRTGLVMGKLTAEDKNLHFFMNAEDGGGHGGLWKETNTRVNVPIAKWFTMEYYFKEGNAETGRIYLAVTPEGGERQVVYDIKGFTHNSKDPNPNGFTGYNPMKLYTSKELVAYMKSKGKTLQIYWDDFKLWKNKRPE